MANGNPDLEQASAALLAADREWSRQWIEVAQRAAVDPVALDQIVSFLAQDALVLPPGRAALHGREAIRKSWEQRIAAGGLGSSWQPNAGLVAASGDLGITMGSNTFVRRTAAGEAATVRGRYVAVWRRGEGSPWQCIVDIWNFNDA